MGAAAWEPTPDVLDRSITARFMARHGLTSYGSLVSRSVENPEWFWSAVVDFLGLPFQRAATRVRDRSAGMPWTTWWPDGDINLAAVCLDRWADDPSHMGRIALIHEAEDGRTGAVTFGELRDQVATLAGAIAERGVGPGDRVALLLGLDDAVRAFLAVARLGAIAVPIFSGFGPGAVTARLVDCGCQLLITSTATERRGRPVDLGRTAADAARAAADAGVRTQVADIDELRRAEAAPLPPAVTGAEHPVLIAYTSGTTGRPKGAVHVHGGLTVKLAQEGAFQADLQPGDRACWLTDMGWIMGPWITVAALANGATLVTYDGAPDWPDPGRAWSLVERHRITFLGVSPTLARSLSAAGTEHVVEHDRSSLRAFGSTGEPWTHDAWWWLFDVAGEGGRPIVNLSGGTEVGACLLSVNLVQGCRPCSVGGPALGMAVDVVDGQGRSIRGSGQVGELVVRAAWPGMTRGVWGDAERYLATYWSQLDGVWWHGDWAEVDDDGWWFVHGRSDDTLNVAGKRIGPAELESAALTVPGIISVAAVGLPHPVKGEVIGLWCVAAPTNGPDGPDRSELEAAVGDAVVAAFGKAFRPAHVAFVDALPQTRSAKVVRRAVRARATGTDPGDLSMLEDPSVLESIDQVIVG